MALLRVLENMTFTQLQPTRQIQILLLLTFFVPGVLSTYTDQFQQWYPEFGYIFTELLKNNCTVEYTKYQTGIKDANFTRDLTGSSYTSQLAQPVINCILESCSGYVVANMASAAVVLGLTPTILAYLGNNTEESALLSIVSRRPLLALLVAAGSPAVNPLRPFVYADPKSSLTQSRIATTPPGVRGHSHTIILMFEWLLAAMAVVNVQTLAWQLGLRASFSFAPQFTYLAWLWAVLGIGVHLVGSFTLYTRVSVSNKKLVGNYKLPWNWIKSEFSPLDGIKVTYPENESYWFFILSWFTSVGCVCHLIWGTLVFSSILFVSVRDAISIITRFMGSALACRAVLMYELSVLRSVLDQKEDDGFDLKSTTKLLSESSSNEEKLESRIYTY